MVLTTLVAGLWRSPRESERTGARIAELLQASWRATVSETDLSAEELGELATRLLELGVGALAWRRIARTPAARAPAGHRLRQAYRLYRLRAAVHEINIRDVLEKLRSAGVDPLMGKGWAAARLYVEPGLRPYGDIDLAVWPEQWETAHQALHGTDSGVSVDLHRGLFSSPTGDAFAWLNDRRLDDLYARSRTASLGDLEVRLLGPEDHLRLLCLHMLSHGACRPLWLTDIGAALESRPPDFDWEWFLHGDRRRTDWAACALGLAHHLLGAQIEDTPIAGRAQRLPRWLAPTVRRQWAADFQLRRSMEWFLRHPAEALAEIRRHWPNGIEATLDVRGPFNEWPRLPFQLGAGVVRTCRFLLDLSQRRLRKDDGREPGIGGLASGRDDAPVQI
jgi:hypothetical protein